MALSGTVGTGTINSNGRKYTVYWTAKQSVSGNYSDISWTFKAEGNSGAYYQQYSASVVIWGITVYSNKTSHRVYDGTIASGTTRVNHNNDGSKSFDISISVNVYQSSKWLTGSETFTLNTIPRASSISWKSGTSSQIGKPNGTTIVISAASTSFTHTLKYSFGTKTGTICTKTSNTEVSWTIPTDFANEIPNAMSGSGKIICETYNGSTLIGTSTLAMTVSIAAESAYGDNFRPTISNCQLVLDNSDNSVINGWGVAVSGYTKLKFTANADGNSGSSIKSFRIFDTTETRTLKWQPTGTSLNYTTAALSVSSNTTLKYKVDAIDSRGMDSFFAPEQSVLYYAYSNPVINTFSAQRDLTNNKLINVLLRHTIAPIGGKNSSTATLKYKKTTESEWHIYGSIIANGTAVTIRDLVLDEFSSYNLQVVVTDSLGNSVTSNAMISTVSVLMDWREGGKGIAIGKVSELDGFEINMNTYLLTENIYIGTDKVKLDQYIRNIVNAMK